MLCYLETIHLLIGYKSCLLYRVHFTNNTIYVFTQYQISSITFLSQHTRPNSNFILKFFYCLFTYLLRPKFFISLFNYFIYYLYIYLCIYLYISYLLIHLLCTFANSCTKTRPSKLFSLCQKNKSPHNKKFLFIFLIFSHIFYILSINNLNIRIISSH